MAGAGFRAAHFAAMARHLGAPGETPFGVGIFSHAPMQKTLSETYAGGGDGSMVTRHVFGPEFPDIELKGRFRRGQVGGTITQIVTDPEAPVEA